ncbi:MAG: 3'-5' exonuclease [Luteolibacter sp.]|uniref:3'-5' exonuclease n=1 Tax=Luteolibacter sp. TaxID=1962973 RepID=UPI003263FE27
MNSPDTPPTKDEIAAMELFSGLGLGEIFVVTNAEQAEIARAELMAAGFVGFDTESKPTFHKGQKSEGPHVLQFSTREKAFIFQSHVTESEIAVVSLLRSPKLTKIGFGLKGDLQQIFDRYGFRPAALVDLDKSFKALGYRNSLGAKSAIAVLFNRKFPKSKSVTMSNWSLPRLSDSQLIYAANDAYAAIRVYHELQNGQDRS